MIFAWTAEKLIVCQNLGTEFCLLERVDLTTRKLTSNFAPNLMCEGRVARKATNNNACLPRLDSVVVAKHFTFLPLVGFSG